MEKQNLLLSDVTVSVENWNLTASIFLLLNSASKNFVIRTDLCTLQVFDLYGVGLKQALSTPRLLKELDLKVTFL